MTESEKLTGFIQFGLVVAFIICSLMVSRILQSAYSPPLSNGGKERILFVGAKNIEPKPYQIKFNVSGMVQARSKIDVLPQVSGKVVWVSDKFFSGGKFKKNDVLFKINPRDFELEVRRLKAEVAKAKTLLDLEKVESAAAAIEWRQFNDSSRKIPDLVARKPQLAEAKANLAAAKASLENARLDLKRTKVKMPFNGRVLSGDVGVGKYLSAGQAYGQVFDIGDLEVKSSLRAKQLEWLLLDQNPKIKIKVEYLGKNYEFDGSFRRSSSSFDSQTRFSTVAFGLKKNSTKIIPGVFAKVFVKGATLENIAIAPASAMQKGGIIWLINSKNKISQFLPNVIYSDDEIIAFDNLRQKAKIVSSKISGGINGMKVDFKKIGSSPKKAENVKNQVKKSEVQNAK